MLPYLVASGPKSILAINRGLGATRITTLSQYACLLPWLGGAEQLSQCLAPFRADDERLIVCEATGGWSLS